MFANDTSSSYGIYHRLHRLQYHDQRHDRSNQDSTVRYTVLTNNAFTASKPTVSQWRADYICESAIEDIRYAYLLQ